MAVQHSALTGADLHESKGAAAASINTVAVADGAGSTVWQKISDSMMTSQKGYITVDVPVIGTAKSIYIPFGMAVTINKITSVIDGAIAGGNNIVVAYNAAGASMGSITITQAGSAAGDVDTVSPGASNTISAGSFMRIAVDTTAADTSTTTNAIFMIEYTRT